MHQSQQWISPGYFSAERVVTFDTFSRFSWYSVLLGLKQDLNASWSHAITSPPPLFDGNCLRHHVCILSSQEMNWGLVFHCMVGSSRTTSPLLLTVCCSCCQTAVKMQWSLVSVDKALILLCGLRKCVGYWSDWNKNIVTKCSKRLFFLWLIFVSLGPVSEILHNHSAGTSMTEFFFLLWNSSYFPPFATFNSFNTQLSSLKRLWK